MKTFHLGDIVSAVTDRGETVNGDVLVISETPTDTAPYLVGFPHDAGDWTDYQARIWFHPTKLTLIKEATHVHD